MKNQKIKNIKVHLVSGPIKGSFADATRTVEKVGFVIVRVITDQGLEGIGITYHEVGGEATKDLILRSILPKIKDRDPLQTEEIYNDLVPYMRGVGRKGLMFCALSAVDIALWDLKGKIVDLPLFRLLGGKKTEVPVYASGGWTTYDDDELVDEVKGMVAQGYKMVKYKVGVEGGKNINRDVRRVAKVREAIGPDIAMTLDANNCWDAATAIQFSNRVREYDIMWIEEPVPADDIPGLSRFRRGTDIPLATGEHEYTKFGVRDLLLNEAADIVQADGARAGGYTEMLKIAALTQAWNVKFAPHAMENIQAHLVSAIPNATYLERLLMFEDLTAQVFKGVPKPVNGMMSIPELPGLGLNLDMDFISDRDEV